MRKIIEGCIRKDRSSYQQLYELFSAKMLGVCRVYTRNEDDARDIFHNGFIKVFENIVQLREEKALEWWMKRIFINEAILFYKKNARYWADETKIPDHSSPPTIAEEIDGELVIKKIQQLPLRMQQVFSLYVIDGYGHKEIAEMLGISEGTSKSTLHDARQVLKEKIEHLYKEKSISTEK